MASTGPTRLGGNEQNQLRLSWERSSPHGPALVPPPGPIAHQSLTFWQWRSEPLLWRCVENLAALISAPQTRLPAGAWRDAPLFRSARICSEKPVAARRIWNWAVSLAAHSVLAVVGALWPTLADWNEPPRQATVKELLDRYTVLYYSKNELLPMISPVRSAAPSLPEERAATVEESTITSPRVKLSPARAPQTIVSRRPRPDNFRQTIVQPEAPEIQIPVDVHVPNLVASRPAIPAPPPAPKDFGQKRIAGIVLPTRPEQAPAAPKPQPIRKSDPTAPVLQATNVRASDIQLNASREETVPSFPIPISIRRAPVPVETQPPRAAKALPEAPSLAGEESSIPSATIADSAIRMEEMPTFPVRVQIQPRTQGAVRVQTPSREIPESPNISKVAGGMSVEGLPSSMNLVAVSISPPPADIDARIPLGNRAGEFSASSEGQGSEGGLPASEAGGIASGAGEIAVPGLSVSGPPSARTGASSAADRLTSMPTESRQLLASLGRPNLRPTISFPGKSAEDEFFGPRRVYTARVNMPNFTSRSGSWVLRFAERGGQQEPGDLSTPQVLRKVDPSYEAGALRDHVQGTILLSAIVQIDGSIAGVRLVRGLDSRLDLSAISAFTQWKFQPAMREGHPVELEVLVQIPFVSN